MSASLPDRYRQILHRLTAAGETFAVEERSIEGRQYRVYSNAASSLAEALEVGRAHGERIFLHYLGEDISFAEFFRRADAIAHQLHHRLGLAPGARIAIAMRNYPEWMISFTAAVLARLVPVGVNSWGKAAELEWVVGDADASAVFCDAERHRALQPALERLGTSAVLVRPDDDGPHGEHTHLWQELLAAGSGQPPLSLPPPETEEQAMMLYTSGTTGRPRGVMTRHRQICQSISDFECTGTAMAEINGDILMAAVERGCDFSTLMAVPLFHVSGCHALFMRCLRAGQRIVMMYKWDVDEAARLIAEQRLNVVSLAPFMLLQLLESEAFAKLGNTGLVALGVGGSAMPAQLPGIIEDRCPNQLPGCGYGSTETNATGVSMNGHIFRDRPAATGLMSPICRMEMRAEDGAPLPDGSVGEIYIYGSAVADGYWRKPEPSAAAFCDGWLRSGDLGYFDADGYVHIVGRVKEQIIRAGENIAPAEIEDSLREHPAVADSAVFGLPHDQLGEEVAVRVVLADGVVGEVEALRAWLGERIAHFKVPAHWQLGSAPLPRNPSGKVLKKQLIAEAQTAVAGG